MTSPCSLALLESALAGSLPAEDEASLSRHLEECDQCGAALEQMAGGAAWCQEAATLLADDDLDAHAMTREEWSAIDFTVEHLEPADDPNVLGRLGGYDVLEIIGHGGMGVVLKAYDRQLKRCVAIKVLSPHLAQSSLAKKRFAREAQAAAAVVHPNVLAIHQVQPGGRLPFLVMPLVAGESLAQRLTAQGTLELKEILRIGMQAAAGLAAAHEQGLVHRDVKPANILLEKGVERAVLTDFGLARAADDVTLTRWGIIAGTPQYMSPEQARGEPLDGRSDLFSLGCVLYEMATGVSPFRTDSMIATMRRLVDDSPQAMASLNPELPPWFIAIVERLLEKDPVRRFASAKQVSELLEGCLAHVQQPASVPLPASLPTWKKPHPWRSSLTRFTGVVAMLAVLALVLLGALVLPADPPDIAGEWTGEEWGRVVLKKTSDGEYTGTYTDTFGQQPGDLQLKWSRIERRFNGTWREGEDRFGEISIRLVEREIRGAHTTDAKSKINPATPRLADLSWKRAPAAQVQAPAQMQFQDQSGIELVALAHYPTAGSKWWTPEGVLLDKPPVDTNDLDLRSVADPKLIWYTALFRIPGGLDSDLGGDAIQGAQGGPWIWMGRQFQNKQPVDDLAAIAIALPADAKQADVAVRLARGNWRAIATVKGSRLKEDKKASEAGTEWMVLDSENRVCLFVDYPQGNLQARVAYRCASETTFASPLAGESPHQGKARIVSQFPRIDLGQGTFVLQTRPFQKVEFHKVFLQGELKPPAGGSSSKATVDSVQAQVQDRGGIELVALAHYPTAGSKWWTPEGALLDKPPVDPNNLDLRSGADPKQVWYTALFRIPGGLDSDFGDDAIPETLRQRIWLGRQFQNQQPVDDLAAIAIALPADSKQQADLTVQVPRGNWRTIATVKGDRLKEKNWVSESGADWMVTDVQNGSCLLNVRYPESKLHVRVAYLRGDESIFAHMIGVTPPQPGKANIVAQFPHLDLGQGSFVLQTRPYQKVEFHNVLLQPVLNPAAKGSSSQATFGPVIERTIEENNVDLNVPWFDLDTGKSLSAAEAFPDRIGEDVSDAEYQKWRIDHGVDVAAFIVIGAVDQQAGMEPSLQAGLKSLDSEFAAVAVNEDMWEKLTPAALDALLNAFLQISPVDDQSKRMIADRKKLSTYVFKTRQGGRGVLQILFITDKPRGVRIRYKLIASSAGEPEARLGLYPDLTNLKGDWEVVSIQGDPTFRWHETKVGDRIPINIVSLQAGADQKLARDYYVISPLKTPKEFDVTFWVSNLFQTQLGIYALSGDTLTLCVAPHEGSRPTKFVAQPEKSSLIVLKRGAPAKDAETLPFGPVVERTLNDAQGTRENCALNLGSGELISIPPSITLNTRTDSPGQREALAWARTKQVDVVASITFSAKDRLERGLLGPDLLALPVDNELWEKMTSSQLAKELNRAISEWGFIPEVAELTTDGKFPATYLVHTRVGRIGILQITGLIDQPRGVKIRYKLVQTGQPSEKAVSQDAASQDAVPQDQAKPAPEKLSITKERVADIEAILKKAPVTTGYLAELFELTPGSKSEYRLRSDVALLPIMPAEKSQFDFVPLGTVHYSPASKMFYIQWDAIGSSSFHYYGPFSISSEVAAKLGLSAKSPPKLPQASGPSAEEKARSAAAAVTAAERNEISQAIEASQATSNSSPRLMFQHYTKARVAALAYSPDGKLLAFGGDPQSVMLADAQTGKPILQLTLLSESEQAILTAAKRELSNVEVRCLAFSPDSSVLAVGTDLGQVKLFDVKTGVLRFSLDDVTRNATPEKPLPKFLELRLAQGNVWAIAFSPDGSLLATCGDAIDYNQDGNRRLGRGRSEGLLKLWDAKTGNLKRQLNGEHSSQVLDVAFSPDGKTLASAGHWESGTGVKLWDPQTGKVTKALEVPRGNLGGGSPLSLAYSPDGKRMAMGIMQYDKSTDVTSGSINVVYPASGILDLSWLAPRAVRPVAFSPDGKTVAAISGKEVLTLWDSATGKPTRKIKLTERPLGQRLECFAFSPLGNTLVAGGMDVEHGGFVVEAWNLDEPAQR